LRLRHEPRRLRELRHRILRCERRLREYNARSAGPDQRRIASLQRRPLTGRQRRLCAAIRCPAATTKPRQQRMIRKAEATACQPKTGYHGKRGKAHAQHDEFPFFLI
jgi:hypothetical protein